MDFFVKKRKLELNSHQSPPSSRLSSTSHVPKDDGDLFDDVEIEDKNLRTTHKKKGREERE